MTDALTPPPRHEVPVWRISHGDRVPCVFCGAEVVALRIDGIPTSTKCFQQADRWPDGVTPAVWQLPAIEQWPAPWRPAGVVAAPPESPAPARRPEPEPQRQDSTPEPSPRRRRPDPGETFSVDPGAELGDFHRALCKRVPEATREQAAAALAEWHQALTVEGEPVRFVSSAGRTGIVAYKWLCERYGGMVMPTRLESPAVWELTKSRTVLRVLSWSDPEVHAEVGQYVTETDVNAQYLAAARSVEVGDGEPDELDAAAVAGLDHAGQLALARRPGYLRLSAAPDLSALPPHARLAFHPVKAGWSLPTPLAVYLLRDHQITLELDAAIIWGEDVVRGKKVKRYGKRLGRWAALFETGRAALEERANPDDDMAPANLALQVVKSVYVTFLGGLLRSEEHNDTDTLRPDWADQDVAQSGANMLRAQDKAYAAGYRSLGGMKDSVWWVSDQPHKLNPAGMEFSRNPGKWHVNRFAPVDEEILRAHDTGRPALLRDAIIKADRKRKGA